MAVTYERVNWVDEPSTDTPLSAENLNKMDEGISELAEWSGDIEESIDDLIERVDGVEDDVSTLNTDVNDLKDDISQSYVESTNSTWISGTRKVSDGSWTSQSNRITLSELVGIETGQLSVRALEGYEFTLFGWSKNKGTYYGGYCTDGTFKTSGGTQAWVTSFDFRTHGNIAEYGITLRNAEDPTSAVDISISDNCIFLQRTDTSLSVSGASADAKKVGERINAIEDDLYGEATQATATAVSGLNLAENATKYTSSTYYTTYYIPVARYGKYKVTLKNSTSNVGYARYGFSTAIPANNVAAKYIKQVSVAKSGGTNEYEYYCDTEGYLTFSYYTTSISANSAVQSEGSIDAKVEVMGVDIDALQESVSNVQSTLTDMKGQTIELTNGSYWKSSPVLESTTESQIQTSTDSTIKRTMIALTAGKILRLVGRGASDATRLFFAFDADTGILIDMSNVNAQNTVQSWYLRYDVDTHVYINCKNGYDHFIQIVDSISPWIDISECYGQRNASVVELNDRNRIRYAVRNIKRGAQGQTAPTVFIHCSDIHGDTLNLNRIMEFSKDPYISSYISDVYCTGDIVEVSLDEYGTTFLDDVTDGDKIIVCAGNHDVATGTGSSVQYGTATPEQTYDALFEGKIDSWGVVQPENAATNHLGYFYKDYTATKIRAIFLDFNHGSEYISTQLTWLSGVLQDAYDNDYSVLCVNHYMFARENCTLVNCTFTIKGALSNEGSWTIPETAVSAVETFIGYGGKFICWIGGHVHNDFVLLHNNGHQMCIGVSTASYKSKQVQYCDNVRARGLKSQDLFNVVSIDTYSKKLSVLRVGSDLSRFMIPRRRMCIDYVNRTVLWSD